MNDDLDVIISDVQSFLNNLDSNKSNQKKGSEDPYYTHGFMIATTSEQDATIAETMKQEIANDYNFFFSNCGEAVINSLKAGKVSTSNTMLDIMSSLMQGPISGAVNKTLDYMVPLKSFVNIILGNPGGKMYRPQKNKKNEK